MVGSISSRRAGGRRARWLIVIMLVILIVIIVAFTLAQIRPLQTYLVAAHALPVGSVLTNDSVTTRDLAPGSVPGAVLDQDRASIIGQQVVVPFAAGDIITTTHLGSGSGRIAGGVP